MACMEIPLPRKKLKLSNTGAINFVRVLIFLIFHPLELVKLTQTVLNGHLMSSTTQNWLLSSHKAQLSYSVIVAPPPTHYFLLLVFSMTIQ